MPEKPSKECSQLLECRCCTDVELRSKEAIQAMETPFPLDDPIGNVEELVELFHCYCVSEDDLQVGIEVERLGVYRESGKALRYTGNRGLAKILGSIEESKGWSAVWEDGHIIRLCNGRYQVNLEPGGQFEVSGSPARDLHKVWNEQVEITRTMKELSNSMDIVWIGLGMQPFTPLDEIEWAPKGRYEILSKYLENTGTLGHLMMKQTASVQVSLDFISEEDALFKMRMATVLSPITTAMFANSPICEGGLNGYLTKRAHIWSHTDPSRCGLVMDILKDDSGFSDYIDYALSVPMLFIVRDDEWIRMDPVPFREYLEHGRGGYRATFGDWDLHLTTLFPEVRMKHIVEIRCADSQRPELLMTVPAFWKGLLYDRQSSADAWDLVSGLSRDELIRLMEEVPVKALDAKVDGRSVRDLAGELIRLSREGLTRQGEYEEDLLEPIEELVFERGITPAEDVIQRWESGWKDNPRGLIEFHEF